MLNPRTIARTLIAGIFIVSGWEALENPKPKERAAEDVGVPIAEKVGMTTDPVDLVRLNGATQIGAGIMLAFGWVPRLAAMALGASLVPTTLAGHQFWNLEDPEQRRFQRIQFLKNASMLGGLMMTALDTGGRPSVFWSTRKAASSASDKVAETFDRIAS